MPKPKDSKDPPASFEAALTELESIVQTMEQGNAPLEAQLSAYERGAALLRHCQDALTNAEQKIRLLEGNTLRDLDPAAPSGDE
ncbi:MAG: exodeoxyribonuclease VII small subunit [Sulfurisoma sp.]|nr:exodeoxyribonuclease VII small subunit [Sulfurisoma sp.]